MCGLAGYLQLKQTPHSESEMQGVAARMANALHHRGPDNSGVWSDMSAGISVVFGHRRLSILDLSLAGHQPMTSACGRYVIVFNGEIYNHLELRGLLSSTLTDDLWRGHSDTETLLAGFSIWGIRTTVERSVGMFAFAVWDKSERKLVLGRDRLGEKPLYYGWQGRGSDACFLFGSEIKSLEAHPACEADINREALCLLMRYGYIPAPHSIYRGIYKLLPGHLLTVSLRQREPVAEAYWSLQAIAESGVRGPLSGSVEQITDELENLLKSAIRQQMISDVPLGAFLSGGIDSSTVVALMQAQSTQSVKTFSIGFSEEGYDEATHARAVARHLGTDHTELYVTHRQALDVIPKLPGLYSEPFSDSSQIPTFLVSQLARRKVTVSLSGDGGDELFAGYNRYVQTRNLWGKMSRLPQSLRGTAAGMIGLVPISAWNVLLKPVKTLLPEFLQLSNAGEKLYKGATVLGAQSINDLYRQLVSHWEPDRLVIGGKEPLTCLTGDNLSIAGLNDIQRMMALDSITYLPDDILVKVDRAAMGASLESRVPFLDHRVVEFAWRLPQELKLRDGVGKWILRQVLYRHVPKELVERPKMGFGVPIDRWLRGPLRDWAEDLLDESRLRREGFFNPLPIRQKWAQHLSGKRNWQHHLWDVLMFQAWLQHQRG